MKPRPVQIAGGGLAGLALGIALRQRGAPVTLREAGHYPRHRVCGEFISGRGRHVLSDLGLLEPLRAEGVKEARTAAFFGGTGGGRLATLPEPALCVSRCALDALMAREFTALGGELAAGVRVRNPGNDEGWVWAAGRRKAAAGIRDQWFGLKAHARGARLAAGLEMHLVRNGYVGVCELPGGEVNVCGLFRRAGGAEKPDQPWDLLRGEAGSSLRASMETAQFVEGTFCAVAALDPWPRIEPPSGPLRIGDALTMIPPITGNGMSMALESAALAAGPMIRYSLGEIDWRGAAAAAHEACRRAFAGRLRWAAMLQRVVFTPVLRQMAPALAQSPPLLRLLFARTRSAG